MIFNLLNPLRSDSGSARSDLLPGHSQHMLAEQVRQLYQNAPISLAVQMPGMFLMVWTLRNVIPQARLLVWLSCIEAVFLLRVGLVMTYRRRQFADDADRWKARYLLSLFLSGVIMGSSGILLFPAQSLPHQLLLLLVLSGMGAASSATLSPVKSAFLLFFIPLQLPINLYLFLLGDEFHVVAGIMALLFNMVPVSTALHSHRTLVESLYLRFENEGLIAHLSAARASAEARTEEFQLEIAERRRVEAALLESSRFTEQVVFSAGEGIIVLDRDLKCLVWNQRMTELTGYQAEQVTGRRIDEVFPHMAEPGVCELYQRAINGEKVTLPDQYLTLPNGVTLWRAGNYAPLRNAHGELIGAIGLLQDITARKQTESESRDFAARLERSNQELQMFASVASHDLQEPLRKVQTFGDRLKAKYADRLDETGRDYIARMQNATARMQVLIEDLLAYSRVTTKAQPFTPIDLTLIAQEVTGDLETRIERTGGCVEIGELPVIEADPTQMRQLLQNLIGNALKFHRPDTPPVVTVRAAPVSSADQPEAVWRLEIADNGIGFDEQYLDKIFAIFQRLHGREEYEGTGVGLAVCQKIVERHRGAITASSQPGQGATFIITLPAVQPFDKTQSAEAAN